MDCKEVQRFLHAYLDGEFDDPERVAIAAHLEVCNSCREAAGFEEMFRDRVRAATERPTAPPWLRHKVVAALDRAERPRRWLAPVLRWGIPAVVAAVLAMGVGLVLQDDRSPGASYNDDAQSITDWHRLQRQLALDVSGAPEAVRAYLRDKVPFPVRLPRNPSAQLVGARLINLRQQPAALLVYQLGSERVSVVIFDPRRLPRPTTGVGRRNVVRRQVNGYDVYMYASGGTGYGVTSDMDRRRLIHFINESQ